MTVPKRKNKKVYACIFGMIFFVAGCKLEQGKKDESPNEGKIIFLGYLTKDVNHLQFSSRSTGTLNWDFTNSTLGVDNLCGHTSWSIHPDDRSALLYFLANVDYCQYQRADNDYCVETNITSFYPTFASIQTSNTTVTIDPYLPNQCFGDVISACSPNQFTSLQNLIMKLTENIPKCLPTPSEN